MQPGVTKYADSGGVSIAYQVIGDGPIPFVIIPGFVSNVEIFWSEPLFVRWIEKLSRMATVVMLDKRGTGLSDPFFGAPTLEERMDDVRAVMDAAGLGEAVLFGVSEGGPMAMLFAAIYPQRTRALILYGTFACAAEREGAPALDRSSMDTLEQMLDDWGEGRTVELFAPDAGAKPLYRRFWGIWERTGASRGMARALLAANRNIDVTAVLPTISPPTLILHRANDSAIPAAHGRFIADNIPGAKFVELPGRDHAPFEAALYDRMFEEIERFLTGASRGPEPDRVLSTVLFTDIVKSTETASQLGDRQWRGVLGDHDALMRDLLDRHRGRAVKTLGDGFLATFDGPARAIACARQFVEDITQLGVAARAGVHTGECEVLGEDIGGIAVHIASRVSAMAGPGEVLVTGTVRDLVVGSGHAFDDRGRHALKGVPGEWPVFAALGETTRREERPLLATSTPATTAGDKVMTAMAKRTPRLARASVKLMRKVSRPPTLAD